MEVHDIDRHLRATEFCKSTLLTHFGATEAVTFDCDAAVGRTVAEWLGQFEMPLEACYEYKLDWRFLESSLRAAAKWNQLESDLKACNVA